MEQATALRDPDPRSLLDPFSFKLATDVRFGYGASAGLGKTLRDLGHRRAGVVVDQAVRDTPPARTMVDALVQHLEHVEVHANRAVEPDYDYVDEFRTPFEGKGLDVIVGVGGGSTLDLAKAVAALVNNPGKAITYRGFDLVKVPSLPNVAIPTTAGTGSEVTPYAVFTDRAQQKKLGINTEYNRPKLAILDPEFTLTCPPRATVSSGVDACVHALESFVANAATPVSRVFSQEGFRLVYTHLPRVQANPQNRESRAALLLGAYYAGIGLMNAGAGPAGALSYPLGVRWNVPHGIAGGLFLGRVARANLQKGYAGYAPLWDLVHPGDAGPPVDRARRLVDELDRWLAGLGIPASLVSFGVRPTDVDILVRDTFSGLVGAIRMNPVPFEEEDARKFLIDMTRGA